MDHGPIYPLEQALLDGDHDLAVAEARKLLHAGAEPKLLLTEGIEKAMERLDAKCTVEQFNLLEIMLCGRAIMGVVNELYPLADQPPPAVATVVLAALEGDVHNLGKNILKTVLTASGYRVVDCGIDCPVEKLVDAAQREDALAIGITGLITTVIPQVRTAREVLKARGLARIKVMAGGAALKQSSAESLLVDFLGQTALDGLHYLNSLTGK